MKRQDDFHIILKLELEATTSI